jgi:two-component system, OmpR family, response regulator
MMTAESTPATAAGLHVLVVEDRAETADALATLLRLGGHEPEVAPDARSALEAARSRPPDVVLLDLGLPDMDGWQLARHFQQPSGGKPPLLVAITGMGEEADRRRSEEAGIDLHLVKPADPGQLLGLLNRFRRIVAD